MNTALVVAVSLVVVLASHFVPQLVGKKFGPARGLAVGALGLALLLATLVKAGTVGLIDGLAIALLIRGAIAHSKAWEEQRINERGEAAIAAAEARK